ncbi:RDD family protein (plasmid) [Halorussus limi]|uniref:RDD family protein n=1 Tax=Halorussus limi TaxID=2938695 RepID=A0A8U0HZY3_9EURY|nr:RDD family protein [Halorussus limi]UPV76580.1 RDD family protein [Halorussus limi]
MSSPALSLFGVLHADRPAKVRAELDDFAADADALFVEQPETEVTVRTLGRVAARTPTFFLGMLLQLALFLPVYVVLHRAYDEAEAIAVRRVAEERGLPVHEVDDHPVLYMSRAGARWMLVNWAALAALAAFYRTTFLAFAGLLTAAIGTTLAARRLDRRLWLVVAIPATAGTLAFAATSGLLPTGLLLGPLLVYLGSTGAINEHRNEHLLERVSALSRREGYERPCLVTGKAHMTGLLELASDADLSVSRMHVSRWLRPSDDVTESPDPESFGGGSALGWFTTAFGLTRPTPRRGTETDVFGQRTVAALLDLVFAAVAGVVGGFAFAVVAVVALGDGATLGALAAGVALSPWLYFLVWEATLGRTPGKWLFGLVVVAEDGSPASRRAVFVRNLLRPLDFAPFYVLGFLSMLATDRAQRIGDVVADTVVVRAG